MYDLKEVSLLGDPTKPPLDHFTAHRFERWLLTYQTISLCAFVTIKLVSGRTSPSPRQQELAAAGLQVTFF